MGGYKTGECGETRPSLHYYFPKRTIIRQPATAIDTCHFKHQLQCSANIHLSPKHKQFSHKGKILLHGTVPHMQLLGTFKTTNKIKMTRFMVFHSFSTHNILTLVHNELKLLKNLAYPQNQMHVNWVYGIFIAAPCILKIMNTSLWCCHITHHNEVIIILISDFSQEIYVLPDGDMRYAIKTCTSSESVLMCIILD